ncbi:probable E3 ubiquitin-protein ligase XBOS31 isoform X1 [Portunus trituberculatus]|uniref:probable E3 ubiquitin-protein ligase XBOS31 isoform X1 n=1 Tax=Portunus trituberculatus TaxID=210409 RepID=UPI001E1CFCA8|nr:probable E3 ubiquitin-protein ligase XBOS31 isoform X1 [Portunus trituberculatus]
MSSHSPDDTEDFPGRLLHQAALWDNAELLEDLLNGDQLGHLDCRDAWGRTPLHAAATTENSRCLRILLQAGADVNLASGPRAEGRTCLHLASEHGAVENIRLLLDHGADLLAKDANGMTALDLAEHGDHEQCMTVLKGAAGKWRDKM